MTPREAKLSHERLCAILSYDPATGELRWKIRTSNRVRVGDLAGQVDRHGHRSINIDGVRYMAHRLAWFQHYGRWPKDEVDHQNLISGDNRIENLREATVAENRRNCGRRRHNKSGFKGVMRHRLSPHLFVAQITVGGRPIYLGIFDTPEQAHAAYVSASTKYHGEFGRHT